MYVVQCSQTTVLHLKHGGKRIISRVRKPLSSTVTRARFSVTHATEFARAWITMLKAAKRKIDLNKNLHGRRTAQERYYSKRMKKHSFKNTWRLYSKPSFVKNQKHCEKFETDFPVLQKLGFREAEVAFE